MAGSKFRAASLETISDICDFLQAKFNNDDENYNQRRRRRQNKSDIRLSSTCGRTTLHHLQNNQSKYRSTSITQTVVYPLSNSSKQPSNETMASSQLHSRQPSRNKLNVDEV